MDRMLGLRFEFDTILGEVHLMIGTLSIGKMSYFQYFALCGSLLNTRQTRKDP